MPATAERTKRSENLSGTRPAARTGLRGRTASASIGPLGFVFKSAFVARVLNVFCQTPNKRYGLKELMVNTGGSKGTIQEVLRTLEMAQIVHREGTGPRTAYGFDTGSELGRAVLAAVEASRKSVEEPQSAIPWLSRFTSQERRPIKLHAGRTEPEVSQEAAERVLLASEPIEGYGQKRTRPGLQTRG